MFGLTAFFAAIARATSAVNRFADLFETANLQLEQQSEGREQLTDSPLSALPPPETSANGSKRTTRSRA